MRILMMTNTFTPLVGGVARSVEAFTAEYRKHGHRVMVIAPVFEAMPSDEEDVIRMPAIQHFNGSDFSVVLPVPGFLTSAIEEFAPDIVHSHHPFLIGATALRVANLHELPLVFTHHTMYEQYTHYVPGDSPAMKRFVVELSTSYANLCDRVFAPSESVASVLRARGVVAPIAIVPTGVELKRFAGGTGSGLRTALGIPQDAVVVGHVGRLAPEKNLHFLAEAVAAFLRSDPRARFLVVGAGPSEPEIREIFSRLGVAGRLHMTGTLEGGSLINAYFAMDVFAFASKSETQGMVLTEAMAARVPVVALDASGVREVVSDRRNGRLLTSENVEDFASALRWLVSLPAEDLQHLEQGARETAEAFSLDRSADKSLAHYRDLREQAFVHRHEAYDIWAAAGRLIETEWDLLKGVTRAAGAALDVYGPEPRKGP
jgi:glycosyltransferase involved in cell wall biosynthesis